MYFLYIDAPYFGPMSTIFKNKFVRLCKRFNLNASVVFKPFKVSRYFSLKSRVPLFLRSKIVYEFTCSANKQWRYIGKTKRHLFQRILEHRSHSSAIYDHRLHCSCTCTINNFSILDSAQSDFSLLIKEALLIKNRHPSINTNLYSGGQSFFLRLF